jgi:hypothetical protein
MADRTEILYNVRVDTANGKIKIDGLTKGFVSAKTALKNLNEELSNHNQQLKNNIDKTGLAGATLVELGRLISDSNYGWRAMANNLSQLSTLMITLISTTKGVGNALSALGKAFRGPLGLIVVFQAGVALLEKMAINEEKAAREAKALDNSFIKLRKTVNAYLTELKDTNLEDGKREILLKRVGSQSNELKEIIDNHKGSLKELREEIKKYMEVQSLRMKLDKLMVQSEEQDAKHMENVRILRENDIESMKEAIADQVSWLPNWFITITEDIFSSEQSIRDRFKNYIADTGYQSKVGYDEQIEAILERLKKLGDATTSTTDNNLKELNKLIENWRKKRLEIQTRSEFELLNVQEDIEIEKMKALGATEEQLLDLRIYFSNKRMKLFEAEQKSIADIPKKYQLEMSKGEMAVRQLTEEEFKKGQQILFENRLEAASQYAQQAVGVLDAAFQRELTIEQNKTNAINNELKARLRNENLSVSEKKKLQNQIAQNDEALRIKQQQIEEKRFKMQKAANISQALIETYLAAAKALRNGGGVPTGLPPMYATIATGLLQVAAIAQQKFQTSAANMTGAVTEVDSGQSQGSTAPDFNIVGQSAQSQLAQTVAEQLAKPTKAYIVSKDVTTAQELDRNRINGASLG